MGLTKYRMVRRQPSVFDLGGRRWLVRGPTHRRTIEQAGKAASCDWVYYRARSLLHKVDIRLEIEGDFLLHGSYFTGHTS